MIHVQVDAWLVDTRHDSLERFEVPVYVGDDCDRTHRFVGKNLPLQ